MVTDLDQSTPTSLPSIGSSNFPSFSILLWLSLAPPQPFIICPIQPLPTTSLAVSDHPHNKSDQQECLWFHWQVWNVFSLCQTLSSSVCCPSAAPAAAWPPSWWCSSPSWWRGGRRDCPQRSCWRYHCLVVCYCLDWNSEFYLIGFHVICFVPYQLKLGYS